MSASTMTRLSLAATLAAALFAVPATAEAQGRGNGKDRDSNRPELVRRGDDRRDDRRDDDRWDDIRRSEDRRGEARQGPPFCRNGQGHPVHGRQWCYDRGFGADRGILLDRRGDVYGQSSGSYGSGDSYERAHQDFHARHDRQCRMLAAERPLDVQWQIRVRSECKQRHDEWHARAGRRHG